MIQKAIKGGLVATPAAHSDKELYKADDQAAEKEAAADIRPDAKTGKAKK